ncbi:ABC transporter permease [Tindallia californiensis]|uniref:NitT/TauT family transport system permease protein n=1 Tax=Tindallia californiensis TaxID=159292 RepID=A0A1H3KDU9_9FIRM|nr:ABC transporter permease subunit [Tindallia californiensis]SDY49734.1 NitT/TauT family transport system permease protein [Tindallia californiensis]
MTTSIWKNSIRLKMLSTVILLLVWQMLAMAVDREIIIPSPASTLVEIVRIITLPNFLLIIMNTLRRAVIGFFIALTCGLGLGITAGYSKAVYHLLKPLVLINRAVPTMAIILLALIWLDSEKAPILVGFVVIFPILYESIVQGIRNVDGKLIEMMNLYEIQGFQRLKDLYLPSMTSYLQSAMTAAMGLNLKIIVAAEVLSQPALSIGTSFQIERVHLNTAGVFAWAIITVILAAVLEASIGLMKFKKADQG